MNKPLTLMAIHRTGLKHQPQLSPEPTKAVLDALANAEVIVADNVAQFLSDKGEFRVERDAPNLAPPFPIMWVEYPYAIPEVRRVGVLFYSWDIGDSDDRRDVAWDWLLSAISGRGLDFHEAFGGIADDPRWLVTASVCIESPEFGVVGPVGTWTAALTESGVAAKAESGASLAVVCARGDFADEELANAIGKSIWPAMMAISFMHCKNVKRVDRLPSRQERREAQRRNVPVVSFKTLQIEPMRQVLISEGGLERNGLKKALHICRGHFSEYSEEKPLFGKYSGRFWIPAHVRGSAEAGKVVKDYAVKAPREVAA